MLVLKFKLLKKSHDTKQSHEGLDGRQRSGDESSLPWRERENPRSRARALAGPVPTGASRSPEARMPTTPHAGSSSVILCHCFGGTGKSPHEKGRVVTMMDHFAFGRHSKGEWCARHPWSSSCGYESNLVC
jgi:hypothetical protein